MTMSMSIPHNVIIIPAKHHSRCYISRTSIAFATIPPLRRLPRWRSLPDQR